MNYSNEVMIYLQTVINFFDKNEIAKYEFCVNSNFIENLKRLSQWNFESKGDPKLSIQQFEMIKCKEGIIEKYSLLDGVKSKILIKIENFGFICLN